MKTNYEFKLHVLMPDYQQRCSAFNVSAFVADEAMWQPYDLCSDMITAAIAGGVTTIGAARIDKEREKLAAEVAEKLTAHIMQAIKSQDLRNGYEQSAAFSVPSRP